MTRILLIKSSSMGDVIHNLPIVADIRTRYPDSELHWLVEEAFADIPLMHPGVNRVIPVALRRWRKSLYRPQTWREMRAFRAGLAQTNYDFILDTQGLLKSGDAGGVFERARAADGHHDGFVLEARPFE